MGSVSEGLKIAAIETRLTIWRWQHITLSPLLPSPFFFEWRVVECLTVYIITAVSCNVVVENHTNRLSEKTVYLAVKQSFKPFISWLFFSNWFIPTVDVCTVQDEDENWVSQTNVAGWSAALQLWVRPTTAVTHTHRILCTLSFFVYLCMITILHRNRRG